MEPAYVISFLIGFAIWRGTGMDVAVAKQMAPEGQSFADWYKDRAAG